jgi:AcrR family transcriptional regulator
MKKSGNNSQNIFAKECIFNSLMILMEKKDYKKISITDISNKAGVSRMAYYRNYKSKEDIITIYLDDYFQIYINEILKCEKIDVREFLIRYVKYFRNHEILIKNLIKADLSILILKRFEKYLSSLFEEIFIKTCFREINKYEPHYIAGGLYKVLIEWIENDLKESDEEMVEIIWNFIYK